MVSSADCPETQLRTPCRPVRSRIGSAQVPWAVTLDGVRSGAGFLGALQVTCAANSLVTVRCLTVVVPAGDGCVIFLREFLLGFNNGASGAASPR